MNINLYKKSKWYHKYFGLLLIFFLIEMSISGIILNHKEIFYKYDMPDFLTPDNYKIKNFNRSAIIDLVQTDTYIYIAGKKGVYRAEKNKKEIIFKPLFKGLSPYTLKRKSYDLQITKNFIFLATENGLYYMNKDSDSWKKTTLRDELIKKIIKKDNKSLFILSESNIYILNTENLKIKKITPKREGKRFVTAVEVFFHLHDGRLWGIFGRLLFDLMGFVIIFLSISSFYLWYIPKKINKRRGNLKNNRKFYKFFHKYHKKIGIYTFALVIIISFTAIFMRPPFIAAITDVILPRFFYPAPLPDNPWHKRIENGLYDKKRNKLIIQTSEYIWEWNIKNDDYSSKAVISKQKWPLFIMGATYLETDKENNYIMGSFSGFFKFYPDQNKYVNLVKTADKYNRIKPDKEAMVAGAFKYKGKYYIATHLQGIKNLNGEKTVLFKQPETMNKIKMPLWNWNFELHNGRIFKFLIGKYYILLVPFSAVFFFLVMLSGLYDWIFIVKKSKKSKK